VPVCACVYLCVYLCVYICVCVCVPVHVPVLCVRVRFTSAWYQLIDAMLRNSSTYDGVWTPLGVTYLVPLRDMEDNVVGGIGVSIGMDFIGEKFSEIE